MPTRGLDGGDQKSLRTRWRRLLDAARQPEAAGQYQSIVQLFAPAHLAELGLPPGAAIDRWPTDADPAEYAAWTVVANVILNLDEMFMKR